MDNVDLDDDFSTAHKVDLSIDGALDRLLAVGVVGSLNMIFRSTFG